MKLEDFEINILDNGVIVINYVGQDDRIDRCNCILNPKFATNQLLKLLLDKIGIK